MKALSLTQPWASLCVLIDARGHAEKQYETRGWKPSAKMMLEIGGKPIAIHAAINFPKEAMDFARTNPFVKSALNRQLFDLTEQLPVGAIIGTVEIGDFIRTESARQFLTDKELAFGIYTDKRWAWELKNPRMLRKPIPCKGALSLWQVPEEIEQQIIDGNFYAS